MMAKRTKYAFFFKLHKIKENYHKHLRMFFFNVIKYALINILRFVYNFFLSMEL